MTDTTFMSIAIEQTTYSETDWIGNEKKIEYHPRLAEFVKQLTMEQVQYILHQGQINTETGVVGDYANVFQWIGQLPHHMHDPEEFRYMFQTYIASVRFRAYDKYVQEWEDVYGAKYKTVLGDDFPSIGYFAPPETKDELSQVLQEVKQTLGIEEGEEKVPPNALDAYTNEQLAELVSKLTPLWLKAQKLINGI